MSRGRSYQSVWSSKETEPSAKVVRSQGRVSGREGVSSGLCVRKICASALRVKLKIGKLGLLK